MDHFLNILLFWTQTPFINLTKQLYIKFCVKMVEYPDKLQLHKLKAMIRKSYTHNTDLVLEANKSIHMKTHSSSKLLIKCYHNC